MRFRPTESLSRAWWLAVLLGVPAVLLGRPDLFTLAAPFVVYAAWAAWRRPADPGDPTTTPETASLAEGDAAEVSVHLDSGHWSTVQFEGLESVALESGRGAVVAVDGKATVTAAPLRWGRHDLGRPDVAVTDTTGAWRALGKGEEATLIVRPEAEQMAGGSGVAHPIGISGAHLSRLRGEGTDLADVREFRAGDRLRRINWRVTSRTGALHVNSMFVERDTDVLVVVDTVGEYSSGIHGATTSLDLIARALTAITQHYVRFGDRVAVHDLGGRIGDVRPGSGPRQVRSVLAALARTRRTGENGTGLRRVPAVSSGTLVFFLSTLLNERVRDELVRCRRHGGEVVAVDVLPEGLGLTSRVADFPRETHLGEAWVLRRLERDDAVARLREIGIPVQAWTSVSSLAHVLRAMEAARSAPRIAR